MKTFNNIYSIDWYTSFWFIQYIEHQCNLCMFIISLNIIYIHTITGLKYVRDILFLNI